MLGKGRRVRFANRVLRFTQPEIVWLNKALEKSRYASSKLVL